MNDFWNAVRDRESKFEDEVSEVQLPPWGHVLGEQPGYKVLPLSFFVAYYAGSGCEPIL